MVPIDRLPIFSPDECKRFQRKIHELRPYWAQRHARGAYFTLGASNYWDFVLKSGEEYRREVHRMNPVLREHFAELYDRLVKLLSDLVKAPVVLDPDLAVPGFHIFIGDQILARTQDVLHEQWFRDRSDPDKFVNSVHCDTVHLTLDFGERPIDKSLAVSFTGPIALPSRGSGLYTWDLTWEEGLRIPEAWRLGILKTREKRFHEYRLGELFLHPGNVYHQIAKLENVVPGEERITFQGHVSRRLSGCEWVLYW